MKTRFYFVLIAAVMVLTSPSSAQPPSVPCNPPVRPKVPVQIFPIGGFDYGIDFKKLDLTAPGGTATGQVNILGEMIGGGLNLLWTQYPGDIAKVAAHAPPEMGMDYGQRERDLETQYFGSLDNASKALERRYFLASNEMNYVSASNPAHPAPSLTDHSDLSELDHDRIRYCRSDMGSPVSQSQGDEGIAVDATRAEYLNGGTAGVPQYEWHLKRAIANTTPITLDLAQGRSISFGDYNFNWQSYDGQSNVHYQNMVIDFIYRLSDGEPASSSSNPLYEIDYQLSYPSDAGQSVSSGSLPLYSGLNAIPHSSDFSSYGLNLGDENEVQPNIINFPKGSNKHYGISRIIIPIRVVTATVGTTQQNFLPNELKVQLKVINSTADIFIRGFRIRTELMNRLENGLQDADLAGACSTILNGIWNDGGGASTPGNPIDGCKALQNTTFITAGGELPTVDGLRALAYCDRFLSQYTGTKTRGGLSFAVPSSWGCSAYIRRPMHIYTFLANGSTGAPFQFQPGPGKARTAPTGGDVLLSTYRSIYEDETGTLPPPSMEEGINFMYQDGDAWGDPVANVDPVLPIPRDGIPFALRERSDFVKFLMPITGDEDVLRATPTSTAIPIRHWSHLGSATDATPAYDSYLGKMQRQLTKWNTTEFADASASAFPPYGVPKKSRSSWWAQIPTLFTVRINGSYGNTDYLSTVLANRTQLSLLWWAGVYPTDPPVAPTLHGHSTAYSAIFAEPYDQWVASVSAIFAEWNAENPTKTDAEKASELTHIQQNEAFGGVPLSKYVGGIYPFVRGRVEFAPEIRALAWCALASGAQGILFNTVGADGGANVGATDAEFRHDYNYDVAEPSPPPHIAGDDPVMKPSTYVHPPLLTVGLGPVFPMATTCASGSPDGSKGFTDRIVWRKATGSARWIPAIDCKLDPPKTLVPFDADVSDASKFESIKTYIDNLSKATSTGITLYGSTIYKDYYEDGDYPASGVLSQLNGTVFDDWIPMSSAQWCSDNDQWAGYWANKYGENLTPSTYFSSDPTQTLYYIPLANQQPNPPQSANAQHPWFMERSAPCNMTTHQWPVAYEGFKERWSGVNTVANDIAPIATVLHNANWMGSYDYQWLLANGKLDDPNSVPQSLSPIDLKSIVSFKVEQYSWSGFHYGGTSVVSHKRLLASGNHDTGKPNALAFSSSYPYAATAWDVGEGTSTYGDAGISYSVDAGYLSDPAFASASLAAAGNRSFYQLGLFDSVVVASDRTHKRASKVMVVNRRTWPVYYSSNFVAKSDLSDPDPNKQPPLLGAADARVFSFLVNPDNIPGGSGVTYDVYDFNRGVHLYGPASHRFEIPLDPGQGVLLAITFVSNLRNLGGIATPCGGQPWQRSFNNGRHLGAYEQSPLVSAYFETFAGNGVHLACPKDTIDGIYRRVEGTPVDSVIDTARYARTPSIAVNSDSGTTGLVYTIDSVGPYKNQSLVLFRFGHAATPYGYSAADTLAYEQMGGVIPVAPSIAAAARGMFWVAYRDSNNYAKITLVDSNGHTVASQRFSCGGMENTGFVSVGDVLHPLYAFGGYSISGPAPIDTCYIAFQAGIPGATQIYFLKAYQNKNNPAEIDTTGRIWASKGSIWCEDKNPQIHVTRKRDLSIVWDAVALTASGPEATATRSHHTMLLRRSGLGLWDNYTAFSGFDVKLDAGIVDTMSTWPVVSESSGGLNPLDSSWQDRVRVASTNPLTDEVRIAHYGITAGQTISPWDLKKLSGPAQDPVMAARSKFEGVLQPLMFRFPKHIDTLGDDINITSVDFPEGTADDTATHIQTLSLHNPLWTCTTMVGRLTDMQVMKYDTAVWVKVFFNGTPWLFDTVITPVAPRILSPSDGNGMLMTPNFTTGPGTVLNYQRFFRLGNFLPGDTSVATGTLLSGPTDTIGFKLNLRNARTGGIVMTLDSAMLTSSGYRQSGSLNDSGIVRDTLSMMLSDSVFVSFEPVLSPSSTAQLSRMESYDNMVMDVLPIQRVSYDTSFKPSAPGRTESAVASTVEVKAYPNPLKQMTHIEILNVANLPTRATLYNILGLEVGTKYDGIPTGNQVSFDINASRLSPGTYLLRVVSGNSVVTKRLVIMR